MREPTLETRDMFDSSEIKLIVKIPQEWIVTQRYPVSMVLVYILRAMLPQLLKELEP